MIFSVLPMLLTSRSAGTINPTSNAAKQVDYNFFDQHPASGSNCTIVLRQRILMERNLYINCIGGYQG